MKKLFLLLFVAAGFAACKKNSSDAPVTPGSSLTRIKEITYDNYVYHYTYDSQGRVAQSEGAGSKSVYEYLPGVVNEKQYSNDVYQYTYKNELNSDGKVIRITKSNDPAYEEILVYNPDQTLAKKTTFGSGPVQIIDYFYSNGNCDSLRFKENGNWTLSIGNKYYTDKANGLGDDYYGYVFYARDNKNLPKSEEYRYPDGSSNGLEEYVYEFDQLGRVIKLTSTHGNNVSVSLYKY